MSKERAIALLGTAKMMESPEDIRSLIDKALMHLDTDLDIVSGLELARDMIWEGLKKLQENIPTWDDEPGTRAKKIHVCESALLQIKEYASIGLKARAQGSLDVAETLLQAKANHSLSDFQDTTVTLSTSDGHEATTTLGKLSEIADSLGGDQ